MCARKSCSPCPLHPRRSTRQTQQHNHPPCHRMLASQPPAQHLANARVQPRSTPHTKRMLRPMRRIACVKSWQLNSHKSLRQSTVMRLDNLYTLDVKSKTSFLVSKIIDFCCSVRLSGLYYQLSSGPPCTRNIGCLACSSCKPALRQVPRLPPNKPQASKLIALPLIFPECPPMCT